MNLDGGLAQSEEHVISNDEVTGSKLVSGLCILRSVRRGVVGNISACHADARGSIPRLGVFLIVTF